MHKKHISDSVERRALIAETLSKTAINFLSWNEKTFDEMMAENIKTVADIASLDRISVFRNFHAADDLHMSQIYRWEKKSGGVTPPLEMLKDAAFSKFAPNWQGLFSEGMFFNSPVSKIIGTEAQVLKAAGSVSVFGAPVFFGNTFWGFVLFEDCHNERHFDEDYAELFRTSAFLYINAVMRNEMERDFTGTNELLISQLRQQEFISEFSRSFVSSVEPETMIRDAVAQVGWFLNTSRVLIFNVNHNENQAELAFEWHEKGSPAPSCIPEMLFNFTKHMFPERYSENISIPTVICNDISKSENYKTLAKVGVSAFIALPLYVEGHLWGILSAEQCGKPRNWLESELSFLETIITVIAGAIVRSVYIKKLNKALRNATEASQAKGDFLSNMSHEMRTPLNTIVGMSSIGLNTADNERKNYALEKIEEASSHLLGVINDVLDMAKIEANKLELVPVDFSFEKMLGKAVNSISFRCEEKKQELNVTVDEKIPSVLTGDDQRITQVILNLLSNAVKFTDEGGSINLNAYLVEAGSKNCGCTIAVEVTDTGIGITPEQQVRLFKHFEQAESGMSRKFGGTGLGLAISKRIIEMMGGEISVTSEHGKGAKFKITFKVICGKDGGAVHHDSPERRSGVPDKELRGVKILLAEDVEINREIFLISMELTGAEIDCAENGLQALNKVTENPDKYDLVLMDVQMPEMDGLEATRKIREAGFQIPIIAITANVFREDIEKCLESGMNDHLGKPLDMGKVLAKIRKYIKRGKV